MRELPPQALPVSVLLKSVINFDSAFLESIKFVVLLPGS